MFGWTRTRRRQRLLKAPIHADEEARLTESLWQSTRLNPSQVSQLIRWMRVFREEKTWEGCGGLEITDAMKHVVAAAVGLLVLAYPDWYFDRTQSILIYPRPYVGRLPTTAQPDGVRGEHTRAGETVYRGPVVLNWRDIARAVHRPHEGHHIVIHEFAHQLDMINGPWADGFPPLPHHVDETDWRRSLQAEFEAANAMVADGKSILMDDYGLTNLSEFFAIASELYFQTPENLAEYHPGVFDLLLAFYQIDLRTVS